jgi:ankyrin repeat protein
MGYFNLVLFFLMALFTFTSKKMQVLAREVTWDKSCLGLIQAIDQNNLKIIGSLIQGGQSANCFAEMKNQPFGIQTPLIHAVALKNKPVIELLLRLGTDINFELGAFQVSPLDQAANLSSDSLGMVEFLLERGASVTRKSKSITTLHIAARRGDIKMIKLLLERGANINAISFVKETPLSEAVRSGQFLAVDYLVAQGSQFSLQGAIGPFRASVLSCHLEMFNHLKKNFSHLAHPTDMGEAIVDVPKCSQELAIISKRTISDHNLNDVMSSLIDLGANLQAFGVLAVVTSARAHRLDLIELLMEQGVPLDANVLGTVINQLPSPKAIAFCLKLLELGVDPNAKSSQGLSVFTAIGIQIWVTNHSYRNAQVLNFLETFLQAGALYTPEDKKYFQGNPALGIYEWAQGLKLLERYPKNLIHSSH